MRRLGFAVGLVGFLFGGPGPRAGAEDGSPTARPGRGGAIVADHRHLDPSKIPVAALEKARKDLRVWYGHTSHGSQVVSGMQAMNSEPFRFASREAAGSLLLVEWRGDLGGDGNLDWVETTREMLRGPEADKNVVVWSWCWGCGVAKESHIRDYLEAMRTLEKEFPKVAFVRMTGHLAGTGSKGNLHLRNEQIREDCRKTGAPLFDFADIESYDPDGNAFLDKGAKDDGSYLRPDGTTGNWAEEWIGRHPDHGWKLPQSAAHTHPLNGAMKGRAFWWLLARLGGWDGR